MFDVHQFLFFDQTCCFSGRWLGTWTPHFALPLHSNGYFF